MALFLFLITPGPVSAQSGVALYVEAVMTGDVSTLHKLLDEEYMHIDVDGRVMNKRTFIKCIEWGSIQVDRLHLEAVSILHHGTAVVSTGTLYYVGRTDGMPISSPKQRFTVISAQARNEERILLFQATPLRIKSTEPARSSAPPHVKSGK
jgi:hypothetical protein